MLTVELQEFVGAGGHVDVVLLSLVSIFLQDVLAFISGLYILARCAWFYLWFVYSCKMCLLLSLVCIFLQDVLAFISGLYILARCACSRAYRSLNAIVA
jgi:hypothetical protein